MTPPSISDFTSVALPRTCTSRQRCTTICARPSSLPQNWTPRSSPTSSSRSTKSRQNPSGWQNHSGGISTNPAASNLPARGTAKQCWDCGCMGHMAATCNAKQYPDYFCGCCKEKAGHIPKDCPTMCDASGAFLQVKYDAWLKAKRDAPPREPRRNAVKK
ncbi:hypothetical protein T492DRAFT_1124984 [Pavlovales sp. CCMP2436]|nr:hypothetical protein T492DRAFT_1124984 [Pavlovales sp. CCMP2436]